ncbi:hypothetical protein CDL15_Pgr002679 [Punica granatum]|uniref:G3BP-like protein n=1 Tax=Punica granatum TaxID=22663 RepID=A0A218WWZ6_PUNGR|nr:hypothetical protein CDL15_Pgr002679 [Punica granatum]
MASSYSGPVTAMQVGSYFVGQYYQVLKEHPDLAHQFYTESSAMVRVDGDSSEAASSMLEIHALLMSLNLTAIEVKTINSLESWNGGIVVVVSGLVKTKDFHSKRKFVQNFFLAPQEKGYFVLNDIFQFFEEEPIYQHPATMMPEDKVKMQLNAPNSLPEPPVSNYVLEEEASDYVNSVNIEDNSIDEYGQENLRDEYNQENPVDEYNIPEQHQYEEVEPEPVLENAYKECRSVPVQTLNTVPVTQDATADEPVEEPTKKTYASILRVAKGPFVSAVSSQPSVNKQVPVSSDWSYVPQPGAQQSNSAAFVEPEPVVEAAEDGYMEDEGLSKSVYVRNLPSTVAEGEIAEVFKNFGKIRPDGVAIKLRKEIGVCYAFVEFEDMVGVHNAIKLAGRSVYIEERRANSTGAARGGRRGRGRGGYPTEAQRGRFGAQSLSRGSNLDSTDYSRSRGNGSYVRGS